MIWICATCGVETAELAEPPATCAICSDERQWVPASGQAWTTLTRLAEAGTTTNWFEVEPDLFGITASLKVGIGQQTMVVRTDGGVLVFDPLGFVDAAAIARIRELGPVLAVAASHPHMYGCQTEWAAALDAPVVLNSHDSEWCRRTERVTFFDETFDLGPDLRMHRVGGHFRGQTMVEWRTGNAGRGVLLAGDAVFPNPDRRTVSFLRSYPNRLPLSGAVVQRIATQLETCASTGSTTTSARSSRRTRRPCSATPPTGTRPGPAAATTPRPGDAGSYPHDRASISSVHSPRELLTASARRCRRCWCANREAMALARSADDSGRAGPAVS